MPTTMDTITQLLDNGVFGENEIYYVKQQIALRKRHLRQIANEHNEVAIAINTITDVSLLNALNKKCTAMQNKLDDENAHRYMSLNIIKIKNAHTTFPSHNIRKFDEYEMDLLHTLQTTNHHAYCDSWESDVNHTINFILNGEKYKCVFKNGTTSVTNREKDWHNNDKFQRSAFMAKMTIDEYNRFITNLVLIIQQIKHKFTYCPKRLNITAVNIADLLLCFINEQYDNHVSYANMSKVDLVFHDVYLLKCITSK